MTSIFSYCFCGLSKYHIRLIGPSESGKTTFLKYLKLGRYIECLPTLDLEVEEIIYNGMSMVFWDSRSLTDFSKTNLMNKNINIKSEGFTFDAIIFCVDSSDDGRYKIGAKYLNQVLLSYPKTNIVLILCTKSDQAGSHDTHDIPRLLSLGTLISKHETGIFKISCKEGLGIDQAMNWLHFKLENSRSLFQKCLCYNIN